MSDLRMGGGGRDVSELQSIIFKNSFQSTRPMNFLKDNNAQMTRELERRMQKMAMSFQPGTIEFEGYFIGDNDDTFTHFIMPKYVVGVNLERHEKIQLEQVADPLSTTNTMLAVRRDNNTFGLQITASKEGFPQDTSQFISANQLVLNQPIANFIPDRMMREVFPGMDRSQITNAILAKAVRENKRVVSHTYFQNGDPEFTADYLPMSLKVDMFGARGSLHPTNKFALDSLAQNKFDGGGTFGLSHIHYGHTPKETSQDPVLKALSKFDERFSRLITPIDAVLLINSQPTIKEMSKGRLDNTGLGLIGVTSLDPVSYEVIGSSYFDLLELSEDKNAQDFEIFNKLALVANNSSDIGTLKEYFEFVAQYSPPRLPDYVTSIKEATAY